ncbi:hypothetical protein ACIQ1D_19620 [Lysinibacillus xylanilyticus]|uniref:hypothetical protein n=1 Tax=Lysinibacillus xylanilyticus TaxID=582475 RepID=UPI00380E5C51
MESIVIDGILFEVGKPFSSKVNSIVHSICEAFKGCITIELDYPSASCIDEMNEIQNALFVQNNEITLHDEIGWQISKSDKKYYSMNDFIDNHIKQLSYYCPTGASCDCSHIHYEHEELILD